MDEPEHEAKVRAAETILNDYGAVLAEVTPSVSGLPASLLPHDREAIKEAIQLLLWELGDGDERLRDGLIQGYVFLGQFIPDHEADIAAQGQQVLRGADPESNDWEQADQAARIAGRIKLDMESLLEEITLLLAHDARGPSSPS